MLLVIVTILLLLTIYSSVPGKDSMYVWSMATAYTSLVLLGATLILGPLNVLRKKNNPVSHDLRRDIGIWCGLTGVAHVIFGIQVHMGNMWLYFFKDVDGLGGFKLRTDLFGAANYVGLIGTLILLMLLFLSNDLSMKILGTSRWKKLQLSIYLFFLVILAHGIMYQIIEKRIVIFIVIFSLLLIIPFIVQLKGFLAISRK